MIYLFICFEAISSYLFLVLFYSINKKPAKDVAMALASNIFASVFSLICIGLVIPINFGAYLAIKSLCIFLFLFLLTRRLSINLKEANREFGLKIRSYLKSPLFLLVIFILVCLFLNSLGNYPVLWDSYSYHLPIAAHFIKDGLLSHYQYYGIPIGAYYPHSIELLYSLPLLINGIESSSIINFPSVVLLLIIIYLFAHEILKIRSKISILGAAAFLFFPIISKYFFEANVDLYFLSFSLLALYSLFQLYQSRKTEDMIVLFLSMSLMLGTRYQGISISLCLCFFLLICMVRLKLWKKIDGYSMLFILLTLFVGSFFYFRNYHLTGNPLFPLNMSIFNIMDFAGHYDYSLLAANTAIIFNLQRIAKDIFPVLIEELSIGLILLAFPWITSIVSLKKLKSRLVINSNLPIILGICAFLLINYIFTPYSAVDSGGGNNFSLRLGLLFFVFLYFISLIFADLLHPQTGSAVLFLSICGLFIVSRFSSIENMTIALSTTLLITILARWSKLTSAKFSFTLLILGIIILVVPSRKKWENEFSDVQNQGGLNIAYAGANRHFQLYDNKLSHNIFYINVDRDQNLKWDKEKKITYHKYQGNFRIWLKNILHKDIDFIVLYSRNTDYVENIWIRNNPSLFSRKIRNIFTVNKNAIREYLREDFQSLIPLPQFSPLSF